MSNLHEDGLNNRWKNYRESSPPRGPVVVIIFLVPLVESTNQWMAYYIIGFRMNFDFWQIFSDFLRPLRTQWRQRTNYLIYLTILVALYAMVLLFNLVDMIAMIIWYTVIVNGDLWSYAAQGILFYCHSELRIFLTYYLFQFLLA